MTQILFYSACIFAASYLGGALPGLLRLDHARMQIAISLVAGFMLGVAVWHMLLHAMPMLGSLQSTANWMMAGLLGMFFLIRAFHFHHHEVPGGEACDGDHDHHAHAHAPSVARSAWLGTAVGMAVHTVVDGVALGSSVVATHGEGTSLLAGIGTAAAIILHKPLDALSIVALMSAGGASVARQRFVNGAFAVVCPAAAIGFYVFAKSPGGLDEALVGRALAFSAGAFLCIALSDLLPELQFHSHDRMKLSLALVLGVLLAWSIQFLEPAHVHQGEGWHHHEPGEEHVHD